MSDNQNSAVYSCPMHPEVRQDHKGVCPECGMWLIKKESAEDIADSSGDASDGQ